MPKKADFERELKAQFASAARQGKSSITVNAGELHRLVGGYPPTKQGSHAMPTCCDVMHQHYRPGHDALISAPPSGRGASLTIRYTIPRRH